MHGSGAVAVIGRAQSQQTSECFVVFGRDVDRRQVPAAIQTGEHDGIQAVCFAMITRSSGNE
jgi:hypothetical protein